MSEYVIECGECAAGDPEHRGECLVALLEEFETPGRPAPFDEAEIRALHALQAGGLLPSTTRLPEAAPLRRTGS